MSDDSLDFNCHQCGTRVHVDTTGMPDIIVTSAPQWCKTCHDKAPCKHCSKLWKQHNLTPSKRSNHACKDYRDWFSPALVEVATVKSPLA